ncbi:hypothetical protein M9H77_35842 [Catharanthus roseus]|uniref:Uncharacterized protein n=1 Tax=Catharanthus roseus TaxID=4058 RepID=A0ACB9ZQ47_CATRO|nr:hypothetical protein M9H77_35842 [Catharanthus roseus]
MYKIFSGRFSLELLRKKIMCKKGFHPIFIDQKLDGLARISSNQFIFRIDPVLRRANELAYEPEKLSIGPYHHGKNKLQDMENYKLRYLKRLLRRQGESSAKRYIAALVELEEKARSYYAENINLSREDFVGMLLLDGCFIIELLRKWDNPHEDQRNDDPIFLLLAESWCRDLLLFENQIPLFVLVKLFDMTKIPCSQEKGLIHLAISHLYPLIAADRPPESSYNVGPEDEIIHLLSLLYKSWCSSMETRDQEHGISSSSDPKRSDFHAITLFQQFKMISRAKKSKRRTLCLWKA